MSPSLPLLSPLPPRPLYLVRPLSRPRPRPPSPSRPLSPPASLLVPVPVPAPLPAPRPPSPSPAPAPFPVPAPVPSPLPVPYPLPQSPSPPRSPVPSPVPSPLPEWNGRAVRLMDRHVTTTISVAERSRLYNDLIAEVNGFRRHFFLRQKMHPKEAYRQARRKQEEHARGERAGLSVVPHKKKQNVDCPAQARKVSIAPHKRRMC